MVVKFYEIFTKNHLGWEKSQKLKYLNGNGFNDIH